MSAHKVAEDKWPKANNLAEFMAVVYDEDYSRFRNIPNERIETLCYRGQANAEYDLLPSVCRVHGHEYTDVIPEENRTLYQMSRSFLSKERALIDMAKTKCPDVFRNDMEPVELLAALQHYGLPTRLLDVTDNALVALYFACCDDSPVDGQVIVFRREIEPSVVYPIKNAVADSYHFLRPGGTPIIDFYREVSGQPYYVVQKQMDADLRKTDASLVEYVRDCCESELMFVYPPNRNLRQVRQQSGYIIFPNRISYDKTIRSPSEGEVSARFFRFENDISPISKHDKQVCVCIDIPWESKGEICRELNLMGINRKELFSDSPDIVCEEIKNEVFDDNVGFPIDD